MRWWGWVLLGVALGLAGGAGGVAALWVRAHHAAEVRRARLDGERTDTLLELERHRAHVAALRDTAAQLADRDTALEASQAVAAAARARAAAALKTAGTVRDSNAALVKLVAEDEAVRRADSARIANLVRRVGVAERGWFLASDSIADVERQLRAARDSIAEPPPVREGRIPLLGIPWPTLTAGYGATLTAEDSKLRLHTGPSATLGWRFSLPRLRLWNRRPDSLMLTP